MDKHSTLEEWRESLLNATPEKHLVVFNDDTHLKNVFETLLREGVVVRYYSKHGEGYIATQYAK